MRFHIIALVLAMMMLCSVSAFAEEGGIPFEVGKLQMTIPAGETTYEDLNTLLAMIDAPELFQNSVVLPEAK